MTDLYPFLSVRDTDAAARFYAQAFDALEVEAAGPVKVMAIDGHRFGLAPEAADLGTPSPETAGHTTVRLSLEVDDPDALFEQALAAGATERFPLEDQPYGMRQGRVADPFGHHWLIGKKL